MLWLDPGSEEELLLMLALRGVWDPIPVLEALYALELPRELWLRGVVEAAGKGLDRGHGVGMLIYDVSGAKPHVESLGGFNVSPENITVGSSMHAVPGWEAQIIKCYRTVMCATLDEHVPDRAMQAVLRERYRPLGICDQVLINGANHSGHGCGLYVFSSTVLELSVREREQLIRLASHLSSAYRLQRRLELGPQSNENSVAAVLRVDGRVEHAEPQTSSRQTRRVLADAVKLREWARTRDGRSDPQRATAAWKPLVLGQWSLVDSFERGGRRYITACENPPAPAALRVLSARELQVVALAELGRSNKVIAYELGLVPSTVRVLVARAASKLGVRTRSDVIAKYRAARGMV